MERIKELLSQDKARTAALVGIVIITLAVPITLRLVGEQQDLRQRASENFSCEFQAGVINENDIWLRVLNVTGDTTEYNRIRWRLIGPETRDEHTVADPNTFEEHDFRNMPPGSYRTLAEYYPLDGSRPAVKCGEKWVTVSDSSDSSDDSNDKNDQNNSNDGTNDGSDQDSTSTTDPPEVTGLSLSSKPYLTGKDVNISASGGPSGTEYRFYIHGPSSLDAGDEVEDSYDPNNVASDKFHLIGINSSSVDFELPTNPETYHIVVNAEKDGVGCAWNGSVYNRKTNNDTELTGETCKNEDPQEIIVNYPEVSDISFSNPDPAPEETITVTASGDATRYWYYLHGTSEPTEGDPVVQSYSPTGTIESNTFYKFDMTNGSTSLKMPSTPGTYYVAVNAHSHSKEGPPWNQYDRTCAWNGQVYLYSSGIEKVNATCSNVPYKEIRVEDSTTAPTPTNTPTPTDGAAPTATPTSTPTPGPDDVVVSLSLQMPGIGQNTGDNPSPQNPERETDLLVFDENNNEVAQASGTLQFDGQSTYTGTVNIGSGIRAGFYYFKTRFNNTLRSDIQGVHEIVKDGQNNLPTTTLVPGDLDQNNALDVKDYNIFLSCYDPSRCSQKTIADLNDDGAVSGVDYNILLRSFAIIQGD